MRFLGRNLLEKRLLQEVLVFGTLFILLTLNSWTAIKTADDLLKAITYFSIMYVHVQLHRFVLIPRLEQKKRYFFYFSASLFFVLLFSWFLFATDDYWFNKKFGPMQGSMPAIYIYHIGTCTLCLIAMLVPFMLLKYLNEQKKLSGAQLALHKIELKMLRSQLNPHFLFNAFNNIYGLSLKDQVRVPALILHISKLMRYQLENTAKEWIPLEEELGFIESYLALEEERLGRRCEIRYEYENNETEVEYVIAPLILITFIENAFKHGTHIVSQSFVHIRIKIKKAIFEIVIVNSLPPVNSNIKQGGVGLHNAIQILDIIYSSKYKLSKAKDESKHSVYLTLPLTIKKDAE